MSESLTGPEGLKLEVPTGLFINNKFVASKRETTLTTENPATGKYLATLSAASSEDVDEAVRAAQTALKTTWKDVSPAGRGQLLNKLADLIERDIDKFSFLQAVDGGILSNDSKGMHIPQAIETLRYFAGWADKITGKSLTIPNGFAYTRRQPIGVCAAIVPWNAPLMITAWKLAPALAAGNVIIIKTPELCPLYGQYLGQLIVEAGFPAGVVNILTGLGSEAGQAIAEHSKIRKVAFTGSTATGRRILQASALSNLKKVSLELGGKGPSIVFDDADLDNAVSWTAAGITIHNGQVCAANSRIYVQEGIYDRFVEAFHKKSAAAVHGDPLMSETTKGPVISRSQLDRILSYIEDGKKSGVKLLHGGDRLQNDGNYVANTAFVDVDQDAKIMREEIFGPVVAIAKFSTESEVISKANDSEYGLGASVFSTNIDCAHRVATALESGQVIVNAWDMLNPNTPFGGVKQSGFGRDRGEDALTEWTQVKAISYSISPSSA